MARVKKMKIFGIPVVFVAVGAFFFRKQIMHQYNLLLGGKKINPNEAGYYMDGTPFPTTTVPVTTSTTTV